MAARRAQIFRRQFWRLQEKTSELSSKASKAAREAEQKLSDAANKVQGMSDKALGQAKVRRGPLTCRRNGLPSMSCQTTPPGSAMQQADDSAWQPVHSADGVTAVRRMQHDRAELEHQTAQRVSQIEPVHALSVTQGSTGTHR